MSEDGLESRLLVVAPTGRDAALTCDLLARADLAALACPSIDVLCAEIERGCAGVLITAEVATPTTALPLVQLLGRQPPWSDLPIVVFNGEGMTHPGLTRLLRTLGNVTVLDRPVRPVTMVSAARAALRARRRQYQAREELLRHETAVKHRDQFLAMLGHELRNPLAALKLAAEVMVPSTGEDVARLDIINRQARHLGRLVDDLLDVARVTTGKVVLQLERVDLAQLVERGIAAGQRAAELAGVELSMQRPAGSLAVRGDPVRLEQVISNLIGNALKYTPKGGHVLVDIARDAPWLRVCVRDDGLGMTQETLDRLFELFAQADSSLDRAQGGLGIGLTVARRLIELHDGRVSAQSDGLGKGSAITISLPIDTGETIAGSTPPVGAAAPLLKQSAKHRVVLVEDTEDVRELMAMLLESLGHTVTTARDGEEGVRLIVGEQPDVALVDLGLPGIDGLELARRVRAQAGCDVVLIALTGYGQPDDERRARDAGFDLHLVKPVDSKRLRALLSLEPSALAASLRARAQDAQSV